MVHALDRRNAPERLRLANNSALLATSLLFLWFAATIWLQVSCSRDQSGPPEQPRWLGQRTTRDGVEYVQNPAEPLFGTQHLEAVERWRLLAEDSTGALRFGQISGAAMASDSTFYFSDYSLGCVHVVSWKGQYLGRIGRKGEGPGELLGPAVLFEAAPGTLAVLDGSPWITLFSTEGNWNGRWHPQMPAGHWISITRAARTPGGGFTLAFSHVYASEQTGFINQEIALFDRAGEHVTTLTANTIEVHRDEPYVVQEELYFDIIGPAVGADGLIYFSPDFTGYTMVAATPEGRRVRIISRDYERLARTPEEMEEARQRIRASAKRADRIDVCKYHRDIYGIDAIGTELWVSSSRSSLTPPPGCPASYDVFDSLGRYIRQVVIHGEGDPKTDFFLVLAPGVFIRTGVVALGSASQTAGTPGPPSDQEGIPAIFCYELRPKEQ